MRVNPKWADVPEYCLVVLRRTPPSQPTPPQRVISGARYKERLYKGDYRSVCSAAPHPHALFTFEITTAVKELWSTLHVGGAREVVLAQMARGGAALEG